MPSKKDQQKFWSFYPSEPFKNGHFNVRHPVVTFLLLNKTIIDYWLTDLVQLIWNLVTFLLLFWLVSLSKVILNLFKITFSLSTNSKWCKLKSKRSKKVYGFLYRTSTHYSDVQFHNGMDPWLSKEPNNGNGNVLMPLGWGKGTGFFLSRVACHE